MMKTQPANQNKSTLEKDSFQKNFLIQQRRIRKYINHLHYELVRDQAAYVRKKFGIIDVSLRQEIKKGLEALFQLLQPKHLFHRPKVFCCSETSWFCKMLKIKKLQFWKISSLKLSKVKLSFEREEIISLLVFFGLIGLIVIVTLLNRSGTQFLMTFC